MKMQYRFTIIKPVENGKFTSVRNLRNSIFLAGPCPRVDYSDDWRYEAFDILNELGFNGTVITPTNDKFSEIENNIGNARESQIDWERKMMHTASAIAFWIPRDEDHPARTTNIEFGEWYKKSGTFFGWPDYAEHNDYLEVKLHEQHKTRENSLRKLLENVVADLRREPTMYFTSDTHFKQQRTLELSRRPFVDALNMDLELVSNWNKTVRPNDIVYHAGDFIDPNMVNTLENLLGNLNFKELHWTYGNYDRKIKTTLNVIAEKIYATSGRKIIFYEQGECVVNGPAHKFVIVHEPNEGSFSIPNDYIALYGHIHGRSFAKMNGFDLASDYHRYTPISIDDVEWFANAMKYWDKNVYSSEVQS